MNLMRTLEQVQHELALARDRYRRDGPRHEHVRDCERLWAEEQAIISAQLTAQ